MVVIKSSKLSAYLSVLTALLCPFCIKFFNLILLADENAVSVDEKNADNKIISISMPICIKS
jgi:hypothetical protein